MDTTIAAGCIAAEVEVVLVAPMVRAFSTSYAPTFAPARAPRPVVAVLMQMGRSALSAVAPDFNLIGVTAAA
jgi:hypothetical protein